MAWAIFGSHAAAALEELHEAKSDRAAIVIGGAMVDEYLTVVLQERLVPGKLTRGMFNPSSNGALSTNAAKVAMAYALGIFDDRTAHGLKAIAEIRNHFAHKLLASPEGEEAQELKDAFGKLSLHKDRTFYPSPFAAEDTQHRIELAENRRDLFLVNVRIALCLLMRDTRLHLRHSNIPFGWWPPDWKEREEAFEKAIADKQS